MPARDGSGPAGMGPMTGRGAGYCAGYVGPGFGNRGGGGGGGFGRGFGRGRGRGCGMGWRNVWGGPGYAPTYPGPSASGAVMPGNEAQLLRGQAAGLRRALNEIKERLDELEKEV